MPIGVRKRGTVKMVEVGSMNMPISYQVRVLTPPVEGGTSDYTEVLTTFLNTYAAVGTPASYEVFDGITPTGSQVTHIFFTRYRSDVTNETFVLCRGILYDIIKITVFEEGTRYMKLDCARSGPSSSAASSASQKT